MSVLKALGLIKEDPIPVQPTETTTQTVTPVSVKSGSRRKSADTEDTTQITSSAPTNKDVEKRLRKAAENSGGDGFDFAKLVKMLNKGKNLDEQANYVAALNAAETMGVSVDELVSSAQVSIKAINAESKKIDADLAEQTEQNNTDQAELKRINTQLASLTSRKETLEANIEKNTKTVEESQNSLEATVNLVVSDIKDVVSKIKKYSK